MVSQLRIYTINRGMMDSWLKLFDEHIRPIHQGLGIPIEATWVNADRTEFLWVRSFNTVEEIRLTGPLGPGRPAYQPHRQDGSQGYRKGSGRSLTVEI